MIALVRLRDEIAIDAKYRGVSKIGADKELLLSQRQFLSDPTKKVAFKEGFWTIAKKQLKKESFGKCAYCEANTHVAAHGDVEHYRPKSVYWWLAYTYDNYLYACQICNQTYKSDNFPIGAAAKFASPKVLATHSDLIIQNLSGKISPDPVDIQTNFTLEQYLKAHKKEKPFLLNPYFDDPTQYFAYEFDDTLEEVKIVANKVAHKKYVDASEKFYGINRIELKNVRYSIFSKFRAFKMAYTQLPEGPVKKEVKKQIDDMLSGKYLFAGMNRYFDAKF